MRTNSDRPRLPALTSIRFFAALWVALFHLQAMHAFTFTNTALARLASIGYSGVSFFFVLSGFILVYTYSGRTIRLRDFWQARFARIYPAFAFVLLITAPSFLFVCARMRAHDPHLFLPEWAWTAFHLPIAIPLCLTLLESWLPQTALAWNMPAWSLSVEAFFYLLFPLLLARLNRLSRPLLFAILPAGCLLTLCATLAYLHLQPLAPGDDPFKDLRLWTNVLKFNPLVRLPEFLIGMATGLLFLRRHTLPLTGTERDRRLAWPILLAGLAAVLLVLALAPHIPYLVLHTALPAPAFAVILYGLALRPSGLGLLAWRPLELLGHASYPFYLIHTFVIVNFFAVGRPGAQPHQTPLGLLEWLLLTTAVALLIDRLIERPLERLLRPARTTTLATSPIAVRA